MVAKSQSPQGSGQRPSMPMPLACALLAASVGTACQPATSASVGGVCATPSDAHAASRPPARGEQAGPPAMPAALRFSAEMAAWCPADACGHGLEVVGLSAASQAGVLVLMRGNDAALGEVRWTWKRVALDGEVETSAGGLTAWFGENLRLSPQAIAEYGGGDRIRLVAPTFAQEARIEPPEFSRVLDVALAPGGQVRVLYQLLVVEACNDPSDLSGCYNPFAGDPYAEPEIDRLELFVVSYDRSGQPRWVTPDLSDSLSDGEPTEGAQLVVDGRGVAHVSNVALDGQPETRVVGIGADGEVRYHRRLPGLGRLAADAEGVTVLFAARENLASRVQARQALLQTPGIPGTFLTIGEPLTLVSLADGGELLGCPGIERLADDGGTAWRWPGLFDTLHAAGNRLLVQELDPTRTAIPQDPSRFDDARLPAPVVARTHLLTSDGAWLGAYTLPYLVQEWSAMGPDGMVLVAVGKRDGYGAAKRIEAYALE